MATHLKIDSQKPRKERSTDKCGNCGRVGHKTADCYDEGGAKEAEAPPGFKKGKPWEYAVVAEMQDDEPYAFVVNPSNGHNHGEIIDMGATSHYTPDRHHMRDLVRIAPHTI
ncbi:hypothetical protein FISHEDRAFT_46204, partial [Fistulina hepatica ATCC 64428]